MSLIDVTIDNKCVKWFIKLREQIQKYTARPWKVNIELQVWLSVWLTIILLLLLSNSGT